MSILRANSSGGYLAGVPQSASGYLAFIQQKNAAIQGRSVRLLPVLGSHVDRLMIIGALAFSVIALGSIAALFISPVGAFVGIETVVIGSALGGGVLGIYCFYNLIAKGFKKVTGSNALAPHRVKTNPTLWDLHIDKIRAVVGVAIFAICLFSIAAHFAAPLGAVAIPIHVLTAVMGSGVGVLLTRRIIRAMGQLRAETKKINQAVNTIKPQAQSYQRQAERLDRTLRRIIEQQRGIYTNKLFDEKQIQQELFLREYVDKDMIGTLSDSARLQQYATVAASNVFMGYRQKHFNTWLEKKKVEQDYKKQMAEMAKALYGQVMEELTSYYTEMLRRCACVENALEATQAAWENRDYSRAWEATQNLKDEQASFTPLASPTLLKRAASSLTLKSAHAKLKIMLDQENWARKDFLDCVIETNALELFQEVVAMRLKNLYRLAKLVGLVEVEMDLNDESDPLEIAVAALVEFETGLNEAIENGEEMDLHAAQDALENLAKPIQKRAKTTLAFLDQRLLKS